MSSESTNAHLTLDVLIVLVFKYEYLTTQYKTYICIQYIYSMLKVYIFVFERSKE